MRLVAFAGVLSLLSGVAAAAGDDCVENAAGQVVCGVDADAVRARLRAEERLKTPGMDEPAGVKSASAAASAYVEPTPAETSYMDDEGGKSGAGAAGPVYASETVDAPQAPAAPKSRGSVYSSYDRAILIRPGYIFSARGAGSFDAPSVATGYRSVFHRVGRSTFAWEGELHFLRDSEDLLVLGVPVSTTFWGFTGLGGVRWNYALVDHVSPFASVGVGPAYFRAKASSPTGSVSDGDITFAYSGRAGVEFNISDQFSIETAYRYLGTTQSGTPGYHAGEVGLNYNF